MALTRRTARFREFAEQTEAILADHGLVVDAAAVDALLNEREERVASLLGVGPRTALRSAPDDLPQMLAAEILSRRLGRPVIGQPGQ